MEFLIPLIFVVVIAGLAYAFYASAKRRKELHAWAVSRNLQFRPGKDRGLDSRYPEFKCLRQGHSRYAYNIMEGQLAGVEIVAFDYHYTTGSGKNRSDHHFSALIARSPIPLKPLYIRRERIFDKVTEFFGYDDIDFESAEFSRKFYVRSPDKKWAYDVIHQRMMEYLLSAPEFSLQFDTMNVLAWRSRRFDPVDFDAASSLISGLLDRLPEYVVKQQTQGVK